AMLAGADAALDVVVITTDEERELRLEKLNRIVVGVTVGDSDQPAGAVAAAGRAPAAVLRLDVDEQPVFARARYVGRTETDIGAGGETFGRDAGERLPDELRGLRRALVVPAGRRRFLGGEDGARRRRHLQRPEPAFVRGLVRGDQ